MHERKCHLGSEERTLKGYGTGRLLKGEGGLVGGAMSLTAAGNAALAVTAHVFVHTKYCIFILK
jgi:hypothetical protein